MGNSVEIFLRDPDEFVLMTTEREERDEFLQRKHARLIFDSENEALTSFLGSTEIKLYMVLIQQPVAQVELLNKNLSNVAELLGSFVSLQQAKNLAETYAEQVSQASHLPGFHKR